MLALSWNVKQTTENRQQRMNGHDIRRCVDAEPKPTRRAASGISSYLFSVACSTFLP